MLKTPATVWIVATIWFPAVGFISRTWLFVKVYKSTASASPAMDLNSRCNARLESNSWSIDFKDWCIATKQQRARFTEHIST